MNASRFDRTTQELAVEPPVQAPHRSLWLREALGDEPPLPPARGTLRADVAIVGGGFVGLWTAIRIKQQDPGCDVAILERDVCGGGASGRNGGMVLSLWPKIASLTQALGADAALRVAQASEDAVEELARFCGQHEIDAHVRRGGMLWTATAPAHVGAWDGVLAACRSIGVEPFVRLSPDEVAARSGSPFHIAGVLEPKALTVQPARLARGLRRVALDLGVRIHEGTAMTSFTRDRPVRIGFAGGEMIADRMVLATNAWAARVRELSRALVIVSSDIVATAPAPDLLRDVGWTDGTSITDSQMMVDYYRTTLDGRIVFGKGTAAVSFRNVVGDRYDFDRVRGESVEHELRETYPSFAGVPVEHTWGGPIDRTPTSLPIMGRLGGRDHLLYAVGWSGNGVGPSVIGGRVLASLALGTDDEWARFPLVDRPHDRFPPEPLRTPGGVLVRAAVVRKERAERRDRRPRRLDTALATLAPAGLEDKG